MATYILINIAFLVMTFIVLRVRPHTPSKRWIAVLAALLVLTAIFDSLLVYFSFIDYAPEKILGLRIGHAPVEDFFYAIYAAIVVPLFWNRLGGSHARHA